MSQSLHDVDTAMILAAGFGKRLKPLSNLCPKPLWPVFGKPLVERQLEAVRALGIRRVVVNLFHLADLMEGAIGAIMAKGDWPFSLAVSRETVILGTGGGIRHATPLFGKGSILVMNGDIVHAVDLGALVSLHESSRAEATIALVRKPGFEAIEHVGCDDLGWVTSIHGKPATASPPVHRGIFSGIHIVGRRFADALPPDDHASCVVRDGYIPCLASGLPVAAFHSPAFWSDLGTPRSYIDTHLDLWRLHHDAPLPLLDDDVTTPSAGVCLGSGCTIETGSTIIPPVVLSADSRIERGAVVGPYVMLGRRSVVVAGSRLSEAVVWDDERIEGESSRVIVGKGLVLSV